MSGASGSRCATVSLRPTPKPRRRLPPRALVNELFRQDAFVEAMARRQVRVTTAQARGPMGLAKKDHLRAIFQIAEVADQWRAAHGRPWTEADLDAVYHEHFVPLQREAAGKHARLVPGLLGCVEELRRRGIKIATTTGSNPGKLQGGLG